MEGIERGRLEMAILEPSLMQSKNEDTGQMMRFTFGFMYHETEESKLGMCVRGCLATRKYDGKLVAAPPTTRTRFNQKFMPFIWTDAIHDLLISKIDASTWADKIGGKTQTKDMNKQVTQLKGPQVEGVAPEEWEEIR